MKIIDAPYRLNLETPHVKWAKPYGRGPIRALFVPSVDDGRTVVELAQRLSLVLTTVSIDPQWDVNKWSIGMGSDYGRRCESGDFSNLYRYLEASLDSVSGLDVLVIYGIHGWACLPESVREKIMNMVKSGVGLVFIHPYVGAGSKNDHGLWRLSPLVNCLDDHLDAENYWRPNPEALEQAAWVKEADHYVTRGIPFETYPFQYLRYYKYEASDDAMILVRSTKGHPIVAVKNYGKGRVVAIAYLSYGLSPMIPWEIYDHAVSDYYWEYIYSLLLKAIIWAAGKEPQVFIRSIKVSKKSFSLEELGNGYVEVILANPRGDDRVFKYEFRLVNEYGDEELRMESKPFKIPGEGLTLKVSLPNFLTGGLHVADLILKDEDDVRHDWASVAFKVRREAEVTDIDVDKESYDEGDRAEVLIGVSKHTEEKMGLTVEFVDGFGRILDVWNGQVEGLGKFKVKVALRIRGHLTHVGFVRAILSDDGRKVHVFKKRVDLALPRRPWIDYEVIMGWYGPKSYQPWFRLVDTQFRRIGVTMLGDPRRNFKLNVHLPFSELLGVYWYRRAPYLERKRLYLETRDKRYLVRNPCLNSAEVLGKAVKQLEEMVRRYMIYKPIAYYVADECSITCYQDALDLCFSEYCLKAFRDWLKAVYGSLDVLNEEWGTNFKSWSEVEPLTSEEAKKTGCLPAWADHRTFMEVTFANAIRLLKETIRRIDPGGLMAISGTQPPTPHNGCDWSRLDKILEYIQPYSVGGQDEMHRCFGENLLTTGYTGYGAYGSFAKHTVWSRLLHGHRGSAIFWQYCILDPDLNLTVSAKDLGKVFREIQDSAIAALLSKARMVRGRIALHYSMPSIHGVWIVDGEVRPGMAYATDTSKCFKAYRQNFECWIKLLEDLGLQYCLLSPEDLENDELKRGEFKVLILPFSIALSKKEVDAIRRFVMDGGILIADVYPGLMDEHCKWLGGRGLLDDVLGVEHRLGEISEVTKLNPWSHLSLKKGEKDVLREFPEAVVHKFGSGLSVYLTRLMNDYMLYVGRRGIRRDPSETVPFRRAVKRILALGGFEEEYEIRVNGNDPVGCELAVFEDDLVRFLAVLEEPRLKVTVGADGVPTVSEEAEEYKPEDSLTIKLPARCHVYDVRAKRYMGFLDMVEASIKPAEPLILALTPEIVKSVEVEAPRKVKVGEELKVRIRVLGLQHNYVVRVNVYRPSGLCREYSGVVYTEEGEAVWRVQTALNDEQGPWLIEAVEAISGLKAASTVYVSN
ncbi:beta-galactosidase [Candidatus Bathyarchaeota archaeon]|nr:beta-galactosidase [Candidatus Bathyarchaeota archaeon]